MPQIESVGSSNPSASFAYQQWPAGRCQSRSSRSVTGVCKSARMQTRATLRNKWTKKTGQSKPQSRDTRNDDDIALIPRRAHWHIKVIASTPRPHPRLIGDLCRVYLAPFMVSASALRHAPPASPPARPPTGSNRFRWPRWNNDKSKRKKKNNPERPVRFRNTNRRTTRARASSSSRRSARQRRTSRRERESRKCH